MRSQDQASQRAPGWLHSATHQRRLQLKLQRDAGDARAVLISKDCHRMFASDRGQSTAQPTALPVSVPTPSADSVDNAPPAQASTTLDSSPQQPANRSQTGHVPRTVGRGPAVDEPAAATSPFARLSIAPFAAAADRREGGFLPDVLQHCDLPSLTDVFPVNHPTRGAAVYVPALPALPHNASLAALDALPPSPAQGGRAGPPPAEATSHPFASESGTTASSGASALPGFIDPDAIHRTSELSGFNMSVRAAGPIRAIALQPSTDATTSVSTHSRSDRSAPSSCLATFVVPPPPPAPRAWAPSTRLARGAAPRTWAPPAARPPAGSELSRSDAESSRAPAAQRRAFTKALARQSSLRLWKRAARYGAALSGSLSMPQLTRHSLLTAASLKKLATTLANTGNSDLISAVHGPHHTAHCRSAQDADDAARDAVDATDIANGPAIVAGEGSSGRSGEGRMEREMSLAVPQQRATSALPRFHFQRQTTNTSLSSASVVSSTVDVDFSNMPSFAFATRVGRHSFTGAIADVPAVAPGAGPLSYASDNEDSASFGVFETFQQQVARAATSPRLHAPPSTSSGWPEALVGGSSFITDGGASMHSANALPGYATSTCESLAASMELAGSYSAFTAADSSPESPFKSRNGLKVPVPMAERQGPAVGRVQLSCEDVLGLSRQHDQVTVGFIDLKGFTELSGRLQAHEVMLYLNVLFSTFDALCQRWDLYKVATVGDCYIVVGGLMSSAAKGGKCGEVAPEAQACKKPLLQSSVESHMKDVLERASMLTSAAIAPTVREGVDEGQVHKVILFALEALEACAKINDPLGRATQCRVGVHAGPVVSGVIGMLNPRFDLFGDTMNVAARMESLGEPGRLHVSQSVADLMPQVPWAARGEVPVKGKGVMKTHFFPLEQASELKQVLARQLHAIASLAS